MGLSQVEVVHALDSGKKIGSKGWQTSEFIQIVDGRLVDENGEELNLGNILYDNNDFYIIVDESKEEVVDKESSASVEVDNKDSGNVNKAEDDQSEKSDDLIKELVVRTLYSMWKRQREAELKQKSKTKCHDGKCRCKMIEPGVVMMSIESGSDLIDLEQSMMEFLEKFKI